MRRLSKFAAVLSTLMVFNTPLSWGQKPPPPIVPNPQAPVLGMPVPLGVQRGSSIELNLTGTNLAGPTGLWTSFPAKVTIPTDSKNGTDNTKLRVRLEVPADAPLGFGAMRLSTLRGMSNLRLFCIDDLPQIIKQDTNKNKATPQTVPVPCVVVGQIDAQQADYYKIAVQAGQRVSFEVLGRRLGGPLDPELSIYSTKSGRELVHDNDAPGCQSDPRLTHVFKEAGDYLIEIKDTTYQGGPDFRYRLRIGDFPCATVPIPMAAKRGGKTKVHFAGPMVDGVAPVEVDVPADPALTTLWIAPKGPNGLHGWPVALAVTDLDERVEQEPNNEPAQATPVAVPGAITGRFLTSLDVDNYRFAAKKGQKILIEAETLELYSPTIVYMVVKHAKTAAELAKVTPAANPPLDQRIEFTAPEDGDFILEATHLNYLSGPSEAYRIVLRPVTPDFDLSLGIDRYDVAPNSVAALTVNVARRGYAGPIDVSLQGAKGLTGTLALKANENAGVLLVSAGPDVAPGPQVIRVVGKAKIENNVVERRASVRAAVSQSLSNLAYPPRTLFDQVAIAVKEKAPFTLSARFDSEGIPGSPLNFIVSAKRDAGFEDAITLNPPTGLPPNQPALKLPPIAKGQSEVKIKVDVNAKAPFGEFLVLVAGTAKHQGKDFAANSAPVKLVVAKPFELKVEPATLALKPGEKAKLKIAAVRKGGYAGPIAVEIRKLPANVTAPKGTIAMGQTSTELELSAAANAAPGDTAGLDVLGTATAAANLQNNSPAFTLRIEKK